MMWLWYYFMIMVVGMSVKCTMTNGCKKWDIQSKKKSCFRPLFLWNVSKISVKKYLTCIDVTMALQREVLFWAAWILCLFTTCRPPWYAGQKYTAIFYLFVFCYLRCVVCYIPYIGFLFALKGFNIHQKNICVWFMKNFFQYMI